MRHCLPWILVALACCGGEAPPTKQPNIILVSLDTVRPDRTGPYGFSLDSAPHLSRLARQSHVWSEAYCPQTWTLTSHMAIWTSLYPEAQGVQSSVALPQGVPTLPLLLQEHGYRTAAFVHQAFYLAGWYGFERGMEIYQETPKLALDRNRDALAWARDHQNEKLFLFVHYYDAHSKHFGGLPYGGPDNYARLYPPASDFSASELQACYPTKFLVHALLNLVPFTDTDLKIHKSLYDSAVRYVDFALGDLLAGLEELGVLDNALVVVVSDHGEEFLEHGALIHEQPYDEVRRVLCVLRFPEKTGRLQKTPTMNVDLMPTILDWAKIQKPAGLQGESLLGAGPSVNRTFTTLGISPLTAIWTSQHSVVMQNAGGYGRTHSATAKDRLFDLKADPGETKDLASQGLSKIFAFKDQWFLLQKARYLLFKSRQGESMGRETALTEEDIEKLEGLGYLGQ